MDPKPKPSTPRQRELMSGQLVEPLDLIGNENVADMIDYVYAQSGFNGRALAEAAQLYAHMLTENTTVALTIAGAMTPIGMSGIVISLLERGFVDFIIATGANLYHDLHRPFAQPMVQGSPDVDDNELADMGIARIYDVFVEDDATLAATDKVIFDALNNVDHDRPLSTADLHYQLGQAVGQNAPRPEKSLLAKAAELDVPIYTSSPGDSSVGMNLIVPELFGRPVNIDPIRDVIETTAIVRAAEKNGVIEIGGGSPKNFYLQTQPTLHQILRDDSSRGHDYFIQLTTDAPHWGGLSGATPQEARSWGKIKDAQKNNAVVYSCASLTFPLLAQYVLIRSQPRPPRRLYPHIQAFVEQMVEAAKNNPRFKADYQDIYGPPNP